MSYRAVYTYAWDLAETGVADAVKQFRALGLDTVTYAGSYHAGKFLRPHGKSGKVYFPEDGTVYFRPQESLWQEREIRPLVARNLVVHRFELATPPLDAIFIAAVEGRGIEV